jgi:hypothetical protein
MLKAMLVFCLAHVTLAQKHHTHAEITKTALREEDGSCPEDWVGDYLDGGCYPPESWTTMGVRFGALWIVVSLLTSAFFFFQWRSRASGCMPWAPAKDPSGVDPSIFVPVAANALLEGLAFVLMTGTKYVWHDESIYAKAMWIQLINGGLGYIILCYYLWAGRTFSIRNLWKFHMGVAIGALVLFIVVRQSVAYAAAPMIFMLMFEPPMMIRLACCVGMLRDAAASSKRFFSALLQLVGFAGLFGTHLFNLFNTAKGKAQESIETEWTMPYILISQSAFSLILSYGFYQLVVDGAFTPNDGPGSSHADADQSEKAAGTVSTWFGRVKKGNGAWETHFLFPEFVAAISEVVNTIGYLFASLMLFNVTKPNFMADPVYLLYGTFHPCMLLDYLPGSLFAMPFFSLGTLTFLAGCMLMFMRTVVMGDVFMTSLSALTLGITVICGAFFVMVFPWAPAATSVVWHSIPFITFRAAILLFVVVQAYIMIKQDRRNLWSTARHKLIFALFMLLWTLILIYGLNFMLVNLMRTFGYGEGEQTHVGTMEPGIERDTAIAKEGVTVLHSGTYGTFFLKIPAFFAAMFASFELPIFYFLSPLKTAPLAFEVTSVAWDLLPNPPAAPAKITNAEKLSGGAPGTMRFRLRTLFSLAWLNLLVWILLAYLVAKAILTPEELESMRFADYLSATPSSYVLAVGWMLSVPLLLLHCWLNYMHEVRHNAGQTTQMLLTVFAPIVLVAVLIAHTNAIPQSASNCPHTIIDAKTGGPTPFCPGTQIPCPVPKYPEGGCFSWFNGLRCFQFLFGAWMLVQAWVTVGSASRRSAEEAEAEAAGNDALTKDDAPAAYCCKLPRSTIFMLDVGTAIAAGGCMMLSAIFELLPEGRHIQHQIDAGADTTYLDFGWLLLVLAWTQFDYQRATFHFANIRANLPMKSAARVPMCGYFKVDADEAVANVTDKTAMLAASPSSTSTAGIDDGSML